MGLTVGGFALLVIVIMLFMGEVHRLGIVVAVIMGAILPLAGQIASGASSLASSIAPLFNNLGGGV